MWLRRPYVYVLQRVLTHSIHDRSMLATELCRRLDEKAMQAVNLFVLFICQRWFGASWGAARLAAGSHKGIEGVWRIAALVSRAS